MRIIDGSTSQYVKEIIKGEQNLEIVSTPENLDILLDYIELDDPDLVIISKDLDQNPQGENLIQKLKIIRQQYPVLRIIILAPKYDKRFFQRLVNLGIFSIVLYDDIEDKLIGEIKNPSMEFDFSKYEIQPHKREYINKVSKGFKRVIAVYSSQPTGKSYIASNLAYIVAGQKVKTALIDGDFENRALSYYYCIPEDKENMLKDLMEDNSSDKANKLGYTLANGNLKVYTARNLNENLEKIPIKVNTEKFMTLVDYLRSENEVVFIDTNRSIENGITKKVLSLADTILFIQNLDFRMMEENKAVLKRISDLNISLKKMVLVVNRYIEDKVFTVKMIEKYFENEFAGRAVIPEDNITAVKNIRYGKPAVTVKGCSEDTIESFYSLSEFCYGIEKIEKKRGGFLSRLLGIERTM